MENASATQAAAAPGTAGNGPAGKAWIGHPVDLRFSMRLPFGRYYLALVAGPERRAPARAAAERPRQPIATFGNILFFCLSAVAINAAALVGLLIYSAVLRF